MKSLKIMGLALVAVMAMSAIAASAASAASYRSETAGTTELTGESTTSHTFTAGAKVVCTKATGNGKFTSPATTITAENVVYSGCTVAGQAASVAMNGCNYKFGEPTGSASPFTVKTITIEGPTCTEIVVKATTSGCTIKVKPQTTTGTSTATNNAGPPKTVTVAANISNIKAIGSGGICGTGEVTTATYSGSFLVKGFKNAAHTEPTGVFIS